MGGGKYKKIDIDLHKSLKGFNFVGIKYGGVSYEDL